VSNIKHRNSLSRFRCSAHRLEIEDGRHRKIPKENRLCKLCNMHQVEDKYHFVLLCPSYIDWIRRCTPRYYWTLPSIHKIQLLMNVNSKKNLKNLAAYMYGFEIKRL